MNQKRGKGRGTHEEREGEKGQGHGKGPGYDIQSQRDEGKEREMKKVPVLLPAHRVFKSGSQLKGRRQIEMWRKEKQGTLEFLASLFFSSSSLSLFLSCLNAAKRRWMEKGERGREGQEGR